MSISVEDKNNLKFYPMESLNSLKRKLKCNYHLKLPELLLRDLLILAEVLIFSLVDQDNPVSIKECF